LNKVFGGLDGLLCEIESWFAEFGASGLLVHCAASALRGCFGRFGVQGNSKHCVSKFVLDSIQEVVLMASCVVTGRVLDVGQVEKGLARLDVHACD
jgi:hypothetical protein